MVTHSGVKKIKKDHRDYSFPRTFGAIAGAPLPLALNLDAGLTNRNQNAVPWGQYSCTGQTQADICTDEDKRIYDPRYTYDQTLTMMFYRKDTPYWETVGCDLRTSLNSTIVYGVSPLDGTGNPADFRRGAYYMVEPTAGDWFDSLRQTMLVNKRPVSVASAWFPEFNNTHDGIIPTPVNYDESRASFHNYKICGWETVNGVPYLLVKAWLGEGWGVNGNGIARMRREIVNQLLTLEGAGAFTLAPFIGANVKTVELTILETVASYLRWIIAHVTN